MAVAVDSASNENANMSEVASSGQQINAEHEANLPHSICIDDPTQQIACIDVVVENDASEEGEIEEDESCRPTNCTNLSTQKGISSQRQYTDLEIAAQYASFDMDAVSAEFASAAIKPEPEGRLVERIPMPDSSTLTKIKVENGGNDSDTSLSDENEEEDEKCVLAATIEAKIKREEDTVSLPPRTTNEIDPVPVQVPSIELKSDSPLSTCGTILNICTDALSITIQGEAQSKPLNEGSIVCLQDRTILGCIDEIFGPVVRPMYLVRFASLDQIPQHITVGMPIYFSTEQAKFILPSTLHVKGSDASNRYDEEVEQQEFSDDDEEAAIKKANRKRNRGVENAANGTNQSRAESRGHYVTPGHSTRQAPNAHGRERRYDRELYPNQNAQHNYPPQYFPHHAPYPPHLHPVHSHSHPGHMQGPSPSYPPRPFYPIVSSQQWYEGQPHYPYPMHPDQAYHPSQAHPNSHAASYPYPYDSDPSRYRGR